MNNNENLATVEVEVETNISAKERLSEYAKKLAEKSKDEEDK